MNEAHLYTEPDVCFQMFLKLDT